MEYCKYLLSGLLILGFLNQGLAKPTKHSPTDEMQGDDDYNYNDDESSDTISDTITASSTKSILPPSLQVSFMKKTAIEGDNLHLQCPLLNRAANNILFWYIGERLITHQNAILNERYQLKNPNTSYTLIINNITMKDAGEYYCKILPEELQLQLQVSVNVLPNTPANKPSTEKINTSSSIRNQSSNIILLSLVFGMLTYLRI